MILSPDRKGFWSDDPARTGRVSREIYAFVAAFPFLILLASTAPAQMHTEAKCISTGYGAVEGDFSATVRLSSQVTRNLGIEAAWEFIPSREERSDLYSSVQCQVHFRPGRMIVPCLGGGAGAVTVVGKDDRNTDFIIVLGAGGKVFLVRNLALRFDLENFTIFREGDRLNWQGYSGGLVFLF